MMSGPALRQLAAHRSIHEAAHGQVKDMTASLRLLYEKGRDVEAREAEKVILEHWRDHIIAHADSEEEGLYLDVRKERPELSETVIQLMRDHDLLRKITKQSKIIWSRMDPLMKGFPCMKACWWSTGTTAVMKRNI